MPVNAAHLEKFIAEFRQVVPSQSATAQAIDRREPWEQIAKKAIEDGYIDFVEEFNCLVEACLRKHL